MIELSDFLGNILSQVSEARKHADEASIALAEYYAQDKPCAVFLYHVCAFLILNSQYLWR